MKQIVNLVVGLVLVVLAVGGARAASKVAQPIVQRATATPTSALRIPVVLTVLPPQVTVVVAPTSAIPVTPLLTGTLTIRVTPVTATMTPTLRGTPGLRTTPTPTPRVRTTPSITPTTPLAPATTDDAAVGIVDFRATTSRVRGQIQLSWRYFGDDLDDDLDDGLDDGQFVVERSVNGGAWRFVADCALPFDANTEIYRCRDTGLYSGSSYAYRICVAQDIPSCAGALTVETEPIKAP